MDPAAASRAASTALCTGASPAIVSCGVASFGTAAAAVVASLIDPASLPRPPWMPVIALRTRATPAATATKPAPAARDAASCA